MAKRKFVADGGHGGFGVTAGKRTPDGEYEWDFNNVVATAFANELETYEDTEVLRVDDVTGKTDVPLEDRVAKANAYGAEAYVSFHENAYLGIWGTHTGTETYTSSNASAKSREIAAAAQKATVDAMQIRDRGLKVADFYVIKYTKMPAVLIEGGYMDSSIDIDRLRNEAVLKQAGINVATAIAKIFGLRKKVVVASTDTIHVVSSGDTLWGISRTYGVSVNEIKSWNNLESDTIYVGQKLIVKKPKAAVAPKPTPAPAPKPKPKPKPTGIKAVGKIKITNLTNFTYIYSKPNGSSSRIGKAYKNKVFSIAGSVPGWYEIIYNGKRAYVKAKYGRRV